MNPPVQDDADNDEDVREDGHQDYRDQGHGLHTDYKLGISAQLQLNGEVVYYINTS